MDTAADAATDSVASPWDGITLDVLAVTSTKDLKALPGVAQAVPVQPQGKRPTVQALRACAAELLLAQQERARWRTGAGPQWEFESVPCYYMRELIWLVCSGKAPVASDYHAESLGKFTPDNASAYARKVKAAKKDAAYDTNGTMLAEHVIGWDQTQRAKDQATSVSSSVHVKDTVRPEEQKKFANRVRQHGRSMFDGAFLQGRAVLRQQLSEAQDLVCRVHEKYEAVDAARAREEQASADESGTGEPAAAVDAVDGAGAADEAALVGEDDGLTAALGVWDQYSTSPM